MIRLFDPAELAEWTDAQLAASLAHNEHELIREKAHVAALQQRVDSLNRETDRRTAREKPPI